MSKYRLIKTEFRNPDSLIRALNDLGLNFARSSNLRENGVTLKTHWAGRVWQGEDRQAAVAISQEDLQKFLGFKPMDGMGFAWNGQGFDLIQDHHDESRPPIVEMMNKLRQRYGFHEVQRLARAKGYTVRETASADGQIRIVLAKR